MKNFRAIPQIPANAIPGTPTVHFVTSEEDNDLIAIERTKKAAEQAKKNSAVAVKIEERPVFTQFPGFSLTGL